MTKSVCLHAACARSPRANPWTGEVDGEQSAFPYPDWASRAQAQCYGPLAFDPRRDAQDRVCGADNLFARLSFSFSPQLLAWLERAHAPTYRRVLEADRDSLARLGHGNALAQPYGDAPLTRLSPRDQRTALRWGRADFAARFGRPAEGLWLPEQAAHETLLEAAVAEGFAFAILPARSAGRVRVVGAGEQDWTPARPETFNPTRPYRWRSRRVGGAELALFFPHERLGAALAAGRTLSPEALCRSVRARFLPDESTQLVHAVLAAEPWALAVPAAAALLGQSLRALETDGVPLTNYACFLDRFPPPQEVELAPVPDADEPAWRAGLRQALQDLAQRLDESFLRELDGILSEPWAARDDFGAVLCAPGARAVDEYLGRHGSRRLTPAQSRQALRLLESQRRRLLMLSECGWDSASLIDAEPMQALRQACRALELCGERDSRLRESLAAVQTSSKSAPDAAAVWSREVAPAAVDWRRAAAHFAILEHLGVGPAPRPPKPGERFTWLESSAQRQARSLPAGRNPSWSWIRAVLRDGELWQKRKLVVCVHQLERLDLAAWVLPAGPAPAELSAAFTAGPAEEFRAELCRRYGEAYSTLDALWPDERLQALRWLLPDPAGGSFRQAFLRDWSAAVGRWRRGEPEAETPLLELLARSKQTGLPADQLPWADLARRAVGTSLEAFLASGQRPDLDRALRWLTAAEAAALHLDLFELRTRMLAWLGQPAPAPAERALARILAEKLGLAPALFCPEACPQ